MVLGGTGMNRKTKEFIFRGVVVSGLGEGQYFTQLDWVRQQFLAKFGFEPIAGTFNIKVDPESETLLATLRNFPGIAILPPSSEFCAAKCFPARVGSSIDGVLVIPLVEFYPRGLMEIVAPVRVRQTLGVDDNDSVEVRVSP